MLLFVRQSVRSSLIGAPLSLTDAAKGISSGARFRDDPLVASGVQSPPNHSRRDLLKFLNNVGLSKPNQTDYEFRGRGAFDNCHVPALGLSLGPAAHTQLIQHGTYRYSYGGELHYFTYTPKEREEEVPYSLPRSPLRSQDVDIAIQYSGMCASDLHTPCVPAGVPSTTPKSVLPSSLPRSLTRARRSSATRS